MMIWLLFWFSHLMSSNLYLIASYSIPSYPSLSHSVLFNPILSCPVLSNTILSYPILSSQHAIVSYFILSYLILFFFFIFSSYSWPILSYLILYYPFLKSREEPPSPLVDWNYFKFSPSLHFFILSLSLSSFYPVLSLPCSILFLSWPSLLFLSWPSLLFLSWPSLLFLSWPNLLFLSYSCLRMNLHVYSILFYHLPILFISFTSLYSVWFQFFFLSLSPFLASP